MRSRFFVLVTLGYVVCMGAQVGGISHLYNRAEQVADFRAAAMAVQALTLMSILGRFLGGWLVTRMAMRPFTLVNVVLQGLGLSLVATAEGSAQVIVGAGLFGASVGNLLMLHPLWLADAFGGAAYARIFSLSNAISVLGVAAGPILMGLAFDGFGYRLAYFAGAGGSLLALALMAAAGAQPRLSHGHRAAAES